MVMNDATLRLILTSCSITGHSTPPQFSAALESTGAFVVKSHQPQFTSVLPREPGWMPPADRFPVPDA